MADELHLAAIPFAHAFDRFSDPGTSDLDNEQPVSISMTLGDWRRLRLAVAQYIRSEQPVIIQMALGDWDRLRTAINTIAVNPPIIAKLLNSQ
jgi:hypothetical protein